MGTESLDGPRLPDAVQLEQTHLRLPSQPSWIEPAVEYLKERAVLCGACQAGRAAKLTVALHEALNNAIVHGNLEIKSDLKEQGDAYARALAVRSADPAYSGRTVDVFVDYDGQRCQWAITDQGPGFDVEAVVQRTCDEEPDLLLASGRGILLMRSFMDDLRYEAGGRRAILTLRRASGQDNRRQERQSLQAPLQVVPVRPDGTPDWEASCVAVSRNISAEGLGLLQGQLSVSDRVIVRVPVKGGQPLDIPAEVRHWRTVGPGVVELGCRFEAPAEVRQADGGLADAIDRLLQGTRAPAEQDERRQHPRVSYSEPVDVLPGDGSAVRGYPRNLSKGGVAFITTRELPPTFVVAFTAGAGGPPLRVRAAMVRSARVQEGFYDVAARFIGFAEDDPEGET